MNQYYSIYFRHETDAKHARPIKGPKINYKDTWPEIQITDPTAYGAQIWVQLVEKDNSDKKDGNKPRPSPNGLFLKQNKGRDVIPPPGIEIYSNGHSNGKNMLIIR